MGQFLKECDWMFQTYVDPLYGRTRITDEELRLCQLPAMARLRRVSLSAVPPWLIPAGTASSRFEHSLGCALLARSLSGRFPDVANELRIALMLHDVGSTCFSHLAEYWLKLIQGIGHEERALAVLEDREVASVIRQQGGDREVVAGFITGRLKPYSDLVCGSIDVDNLDHTLRYALSLGLFQQAPYSPASLVRKFRMVDGMVGLEAGCQPELRAWMRCRQKTYNYVYSPDNLVPAMMLFRAMHLAYVDGFLMPEFFSRTGDEAFTFLATRTPKRVRELVRRAERWQWHVPVFAGSTQHPSETLKELASSPDGRLRLADQITSECRMNPEDVCVYLGRSRAQKTIHLPIADGSEVPAYEGGDEWMLHVYVVPERTWSLLSRVGLCGYVSSTFGLANEIRK